MMLDMVLIFTSLFKKMLNNRPVTPASDEDAVAFEQEIQLLLTRSTSLLSSAITC